MSKNVDPSRLGWWLDEKRGRLGLTWDDVAERAGVSPQTLYRASSTMRTTTRKSIERALLWENGSIDDIVSGGEPTDVEPEDAEPTFDDRLETLRADIAASLQRVQDAQSQIEAMLDERRRAG